MPMNPTAHAPQPLVLERSMRFLLDADSVTQMDPLEMVRFAKAMAVACQVYEFECVDAARKAGATWQEIGDFFGMPRQNAQRKYGSDKYRPSWEGTDKPRTKEDHS